MPDKPLANRKVAVLVENQFIPKEIRVYQDRFGSSVRRSSWFHVCGGSESSASTAPSSRA